MMNLVAAAKQVQGCQEAVASAENALADAKAHLFAVLGDAQGYVTAEQGEDEAEDRGRAAAEGKRAAAEVPASAGSGATEPAANEQAATPTVGNSGFVLKPFRISLDQS